MMSRNKIFAFIITVIVAVFVLTLPSAIEDADKSKNYVCQVPITGEYVVWTDGGLQWQGYGNVKEYAKTSQIEFTDLERNEGGYVAVGDNPAAGTTFNDRGKGFIIGRPLNGYEDIFGIDRFEAVEEVLKKYNVPIIFDMDLGHVAESVPLINGSYATVSTTGNNVKIEMELK